MTLRQRRDEHLRAVVAARSARDLPDLLRREYGAGASLDDLQHLTGMARVRLREAMRAAGVEIARSGVNRAASKHRRAADIDAAVARRVGADDIITWLRERRRAGAPVTSLAGQCGRSDAWVRARLRGTTTTR